MMASVMADVDRAKVEAAEAALATDRTALKTRKRAKVAAAVLRMLKVAGVMDVGVMTAMEILSVEADGAEETAWEAALAADATLGGVSKTMDAAVEAEKKLKAVVATVKEDDDKEDDDKEDDKNKGDKNKGDKAEKDTSKTAKRGGELLESTPKRLA